jgi:hypothetical protein
MSGIQGASGPSNTNVPILGANGQVVWNETRVRAAAHLHRLDGHASDKSRPSGPLEQVAEGYRAMDERRAIKTLLRP